MGKFEESWKEVFEDIEISPTDSLWENIDRDLTLAEGVTMKRSILLYQRIAAAAVMFALLVGALGIYRFQVTPQLASRHTLENKLPAGEPEIKVGGQKDSLTFLKPENRAKAVPGEKKESGRDNRVAWTAQTPNKSPDAHKNKPGKGNKIILKEARTVADPGFQGQPKETTIATLDKETFNYELQALPELSVLPVPEIKGGPVFAEIFRKLPAIPGAFMERRERKVNHEQLWASVTAAAGSFSSISNSSSGYGYASMGQVGSSSNSSSPVGTSVSYGMLAGTRITRRVVLQSGIQYTNQSINATSNINSPKSLAAVANSMPNQTTPTTSYSTTSAYAITSANEFVSVPLQAGYLFIDQKMGLQLNSGVSTDFFIRNTLSDPSGQRQSYSQSAGQDSPYRSVNFSGLLSSEVSYRMGSRYRVSVVPGVRYSFNPMLKSTSGGSGNPLAWDVGFRFRYIFR